MLTLVIALYASLCMIILQTFMENTTKFRIAYFTIILIIAINSIVIELLKHTVYNIEFKFNKVIFTLIIIASICIIATQTVLCYFVIRADSDYLYDYLYSDYLNDLEFVLLIASASVTCALIIAAIVFVCRCPRNMLPRMNAILILVHCVSTVIVIVVISVFYYIRGYMF